MRINALQIEQPTSKIKKTVWFRGDGLLGVRLRYEIWFLKRNLHLIGRRNAN
ncbi:hypothetical protein Z948_2563 [Sulfitobacter donghicola DSW-25 = KCTC 12864 = JCM 14565]|uniref:Uncharacterized protein n=1 Tax=Sulfitobacter donghicola DSW-25 = KCTC 12864 = JCM 14565 TaxID=1300350 RepID=A0A073IS58_9RHOB|nr:hypothetical protein DSW25_16310 [Sulfitobacter donghicola DSW-25 = KCTC 12864 = JCM 14565]KIN68831.1 hypothetical protein Z948_2563 [Sulfitobacter donghicola DSW-25 = KCTC 12864 = JCM 14565]